MLVLAKWIYRVLQATVIKDGLLPLFFSKQRILDGTRNLVDIQKLELSYFDSSISRYWFHAASVGELESLTSLVLAAAAKKVEIVLTVFSESAKGVAETLKQNLISNHATVIYVGYSPWEGDWKFALEKIKPTLFITAKYEAWPDLWMSLEELNIPLIIISVKVRRSLRVVRWFCLKIAGKLPQLHLFPGLDGDIEPLKELFPAASILATGEPRWDRVYERSKRGNKRAHELIQTYKDLKRPWGVIGSSWIEDLEFLNGHLKKIGGTLWIVPHQVDSIYVRTLEKFLLKQGIRPIRTRQSNIETSSELNSMLTPCLLVNEMGFLSELYSVADWAYVGGGFGAGIHSTIEPGFYGIPISAGPKGTEKFSEIEQLMRTGQLFIMRKSSDIEFWFKNSYYHSQEQKLTWKKQALERIGATQKILETIEKITRPC